MKENDPSNKEGHLRVQFPMMPLPADYLILDTDYASYSAVYNCEQGLFGLIGSEPTVVSGWILTRDGNATEATVSFESQCN